MIDLYSWTTPNGHKVHILLEEAGIEYRAHPVNIRAGDQFESDFLRISPNNRIPAIIDSDGPGGEPISLFESGAILVYLAEKTGQFLSSDPVTRYKTLQWLMFQMGGVGPMFGQAHHFIKYAPERIDYAVDRYHNEAKRLYNVLDRRLEASEYLAGDYSIADMATFPWVRRHEVHEVDLAEFSNVERWFRQIDARAAVQRGIAVLTDAEAQTVDEPDKAFEVMFGKTQYMRR